MNLYHLTNSGCDSYSLEAKNLVWLPLFESHRSFLSVSVQSRDSNLKLFLTFGMHYSRFEGAFLVEPQDLTPTKGVLLIILQQRSCFLKLFASTSLDNTQTLVSVLFLGRSGTDKM